MNTAASFSEADLRAIRRTFLTRKATPEEIRLVLRPKHRTTMVWVMGFLVAIVMGWSVWMLARLVFTDIEPLKALLVADFWAGLCLLVLLHVLIFGLLPAVYVARFELILRPGSLYVTMSGLGFEQRRHAGCCAIINRRLWCNFTADSVPYELLRRWWQLPLPLGKGVAAIAQILKTANLALHDSLETGGGRSAILDASRRKLLAQAFGEAITTDREIVLLLPPANIWTITGALAGALGVPTAVIWDAYHGLGGCTYDLGLQQLVCHLRAMPIWLPTLATYFLFAVPWLLADPWVRRALAIVPRGQRLLRIQKGGRIRGEYPWSGEEIFVSDARGLETMRSFVSVKTRAWTGYNPVRERHFEEYTMAMYALDAWAMGKPVPWEHEDG